MVLFFIIIAYFFSFFLLGNIIFKSFKRSSFGFLIFKYLFFIICGVVVFPVVDLFDVLQKKEVTLNCLDINQIQGVLVSLHVLFFSIGSLQGYYKKRSNNYFNSKKVQNVVNFNQIIIGWTSLLVGFLIYFIFFLLVGWDVALQNAILARAGIFVGFLGVEKYLFLKTFADIGLVSAFFIPYALKEKKYLFVFLSFIFIFIVYLNSISRGLLLSYLIIPVFLYIWMERKKSKNIFLGFSLISLSFLILAFGKQFGHYMSNLIQGKSYVFQESIAQTNYLETLLLNLNYQWYSIQAGINHFFDFGPFFVAKDYLLAVFFGFIPSRILDFFGLSVLYYGNVEKTLPHVNTLYFGLENSTIPPQLIGYSAYIFPLAGAWIAGFLFFRISICIEEKWIVYERNYQYDMLWFPFFCFHELTVLSSFIASNARVAVAQIIWVFFLFKIIPKFVK
jgi:hypothetical protein